MKKIVGLVRILLLVAAVLFVAGTTVFLINYIKENLPSFDFNFILNPDSYMEPDIVPTESIPLLDVYPGDYPLEYKHPETGNYLKYYLYVPENATENMPLIIFLHGIGEVGSLSKIEKNPLIEQIRLVYGEEFPAIILAPNTQSSWSKDNVITTLKALIDQVVTDYRIDSSQITITGHSMGAGGVFRMIHQYGTYFKSAVAISPPTVPDVSACMEVPVMSFADFKESSNLPFLFFAEKVNSLGGNTVHITLDGYTHNETAYGAFTQDLFEWILSE